MLDSFERVFDYSDFENKLRHYFMDTAPIHANVEMRLKEVKISTGGKLTVQAFINDKIGIKENIARIIKCCEQSLYPKMLDLSEHAIKFSEEQKEKMLLQGFSLDQIYEKQLKKYWHKFIIVRFNSAKNSIDYREESTGKLFRAHLNRPLAMCRDNLLRLSEGGQDGMLELYKFITGNSEIEEIERI